MKTLYLVRGLPGSGKSTFACSLNIPHCEADTYFYNVEGEYHFDASKLSEAHLFCQNNVTLLMESGSPQIVVSNTFSRRWEMDFYYAIAHKFDYTVVEMTMTGKLFPNVHGVPQSTIDVMRERWER
jgi:predicted kinase